MQKSILFIVIILFLTSQLCASEGYVAKKQKSMLAGMNWSICSTAIPVGTGLVLMGVDDAYGWVALGGIILGPSAGHFYAHQWVRGLAGISLRTVVTAGLFAAIAKSENFGSIATIKENRPAILC